MTSKIATFFFATTLGLASIAAGGSRLQSMANAKAKPRITQDALQLQQAATLPQGDTRAVSVKELRPIIKSTRKDVRSLIARSAIISTPTHWTIVPKEALLHVPAHFQTRINGKRSGRLLPWKEFYTLNRNWITTESVDFEQASGKSPLGEETRQVYRDLGRVVVAVFQGGPISVKTPPLDEAAAQLAPDAPQ